MSKNKNERIMEVLEELGDEDTREMWNQYCDERADYEEKVLLFAEMVDELSDLNFLEAIQHIDMGEFNTNDDYAQETIYGWRTFSDLFDVVDLGVLADYIEESEEDFGNWDLQEILEEEDEE